jgi:hypothetical protein
VPDRIGPIPFIFNAIKEEMTATEALNAYREGGGAIRTQRFYHAFAEVSAEIAVRPIVEQANPNQVPSGDMITERASSRPGAFLARGGVMVSTRVVNPQTDKVSEVTQVNFGSVRYQTLPTIAEIESDIASQFGTEGRSGVQNSTVIGTLPPSILSLVEVEDE